jgi:sulfur-oxidizing protein SoxX
MRPSLVLGLCLLPAFAAGGDRAPVAYTVVDGAAIPDPVSAEPADAARGAEAAADPARGDCVACHDGAAAPTPAAMAVGDVGALRLSIVDLSIRDPGLIGHAFYDIDPDGGEDAVAETRLTAQEVEDVLAWLRAAR